LASDFAYLRRPHGRQHGGNIRHGKERIDGKTLVVVNLAEIAHKPKPATARSVRDERAAVAVLAAKVEALHDELGTWSPRDDHTAVALLKAQVGTLHVELIKAEAVAADHRANFAAERSRCDTLVAELLKAT
jgi:hypothetical protein